MTHAVGFTDGASAGNPGPAGWGAVMALTKESDDSHGQAAMQAEEIGGAIGSGTNNEAELTAAVKALQWANKKSADKLIIYTDSSYLIDGATGWVFGWQKNGWKTKSGDSVKNQSLWRQIADLQDKLAVSYEKVSGHTGIPANERADDIATAFAADKNPNLHSGDGDDFDISLQPESEEIPNAPIYLSCIDGVVKEHTTWDQCKSRVKGKDAQFRKVQTKSEKRSVLAEWGEAPDEITD